MILAMFFPAVQNIDLLHAKNSSYLQFNLSYIFLLRVSVSFASIIVMFVSHGNQDCLATHVFDSVLIWFMFSLCKPPNWISEIPPHFETDFFQDKLAFCNYLLKRTDCFINVHLLGRQRYFTREFTDKRPPHEEIRGSLAANGSAWASLHFSLRFIAQLLRNQVPFSFFLPHSLSIYYRGFGDNLKICNTFLWFLLACRISKDICDIFAFFGTQKFLNWFKYFILLSSKLSKQLFNKSRLPLISRLQEF